MDNKDIAKELGRAGGLKTLKKYGKKHYKKMNEKRWSSVKSTSENTVKRSS
jgi:hypothetical protein